MVHVLYRADGPMVTTRPTLAKILTRLAVLVSDQAFHCDNIAESSIILTDNDLIMGFLPGSYMWATTDAYDPSTGEEGIVLAISCPLCLRDAAYNCFQRRHPI